MAIKDGLLPEYDQEIATTRRLLERVPANAAAWKPHAKSASLGQLAVHVATITGWIAPTMRLAELDLSTVPPPAPFTTVEALLAVFDASAAEGRAAIAQASDADFAALWSLKSGGADVLHPAARRGAALLCAQPPDPPPRTARRLPAAARRAAAVELRADRRHRDVAGRGGGGGRCR